MLVSSTISAVWIKRAYCCDSSGRRSSLLKRFYTAGVVARQYCDCRRRKAVFKDSSQGQNCRHHIRSTTQLGCIYTPQSRSLLTPPIVDFVSQDNNDLIHITLSAWIVLFLFRPLEQCYGVCFAYPATLLRRPEQYLSTIRYDSRV